MTSDVIYLNFFLHILLFGSLTKINFTPVLSALLRYGKYIPFLSNICHRFFLLFHLGSNMFRLVHKKELIKESLANISIFLDKNLAVIFT